MPKRGSSEAFRKLAFVVRGCPAAPDSTQFLLKSSADLFTPNHQVPSFLFSQPIPYQHSLRLGCAPMAAALGKGCKWKGHPGSNVS